MTNIDMVYYIMMETWRWDMRIKASRFIPFALSLGHVGWPLSASSTGNLVAEMRNVDGIADSSFLVEEAYNQEPGVVQHIFTAIYTFDSEGEDSRNWNLAFTQEWPFFSQKHQLSYTVPYNFTDADGSSVGGFGDVLLYYRHQLCYDYRMLTAFAPRFSLILPTGDDFQGGGEETLGYQVNLPFSKTFNDDWFVHLNAGSTFLSDAVSGNGRDLWHYNLGASAIYAPARNFHFLLEWVGDWLEAANSGGGLDYEFVSLISPGVRKALDFRNGAQLVLGAAVPIGLNSASPDFGVFLYVSFEHLFRPQP
ncbi:MAG: transporter [Verrucomicrobia bacterium]|nr:transporter [Verrucomicrobiota bacterium]